MQSRYFLRFCSLLSMNVLATAIKHTKNYYSVPDFTSITSRGWISNRFTQISSTFTGLP